MSVKKCILIIGHSLEAQGAENKRFKITEFQFNRSIANDIARIINSSVDHIVEVELMHKGYREFNLTFIKRVNQKKPDFIISMHCNAYDEKTSGCETLHFEGSTTGQQIAQTLQTQIHTALGNKNRGVKPKTINQRGGYLLKKTLAPCVIAEPFFIDNNLDLSRAVSKAYDIVEAYVIAIIKIAENLRGDRYHEPKH